MAAHSQCRVLVSSSPSLPLLRNVVRHLVRHVGHLYYLEQNLGTNSTLKFVGFGNGHVLARRRYEKPRSGRGKLGLELISTEWTGGSDNRYLFRCSNQFHPDFEKSLQKR